MGKEGIPKDMDNGMWSSSGAVFERTYCGVLLTFPRHFTSEIATRMDISICP